MENFQNCACEFDWHLWHLNEIMEKKGIRIGMQYIKKNSLEHVCMSEIIDIIISLGFLFNLHSFMWIRFAIIHVNILQANEIPYKPTKLNWITHGVGVQHLLFIWCKCVYALILFVILDSFFFSFVCTTYQNNCYH